MADYQLPAHIANRQRERITEQSIAGMGGSLPPHISIQGNQFTLIDASGAEAAEPEKTLECAIVAVSKVMCKRYYGDKPFDPTAGEPPVCWSSNGVGPSSMAVSPQSPTCDGCRHNKRGSAVSKLSGAPIKACRDEKYMALYIPKHPDMMFQLVLTPGSFANWKAFEKPFEGQPVDVSDVLVQIAFQPKTNGVLTFKTDNYLTPDIIAVCDKALAERKTVDLLTGALDVPFQGALPAPETARPFSAPSAGFQPTALAPPPIQTVPLVQGASPSEAPAGRRRRRTKAEMEAARAGESTAPESTRPAEAQPAPFRPPSNGPFGVVSSAPPPNPEMQGMLNQIFAKK